MFAPLRSIIMIFLTLQLVQAASAATVSAKDANAGVKEALTQGASLAVSQLGAQDGFFGNDKVKIALPAGLEKAEKLLRAVGWGNRADELVLTMNRAAEDAVKEAKPILVDAIKKMSVQDVKGILTGGETAATDYFRRVSSDNLRSRFLPIVKKSTEQLQLKDKYNVVAERAAQFKLLKEEDADIDQYVTSKALDGLFLMIGEQEKAIRQDPVGQASKLLRKVFGA